MSQLFIRHKVADYKTWKEGFDSSADFRKAAGDKTARIFHTTDDPNNLALLFDWDSAENAKKFLESPELMEKMKEVGVTEKPEVYFLEEYE